jgi:hypothetical protein
MCSAPRGPCVRHRVVRQGPWEAQIVLDSRRCAGLTAECTTIEYDDGQLFGRGINRCGQARWSRPDNGHVIETIRSDRPYEAEAARQFALAGIAQQLSAGTQYDRQLSGIDVEAFDQYLCRWVGLGME